MSDVFLSIMILGPLSVIAIIALYVYYKLIMDDMSDVIPKELSDEEKSRLL